MSAIDDDEALFEDIYGEDEKDEKVETKETVSEQKPQDSDEKEPKSDAEKDPKPEPATTASTTDSSAGTTATTAAPATTAAKEDTASTVTDSSANPPPPAPPGVDFNQLQQQFGNQSQSQPPQPPQPPQNQYGDQQYGSQYGNQYGTPYGQQAPPAPGQSQAPQFNQFQQPQPQMMAPSNLGKDSGKMFIGGLNWDTTEQGLVDYFTKFGEVLDYTIMRDAATGRSRGFGFLTFKDPRSVDEVVKTDHVLDGKLIDPKRAIAREEQDKVGKIFVGGIDPLVTEKEFHDFFSQYGHIIDAQLMIDKDTGRSRGFGFITYDSPAAVDRVCVNKYVSLKGKSMEVKRAEPRGQHQQTQQLQQMQQLQYGYNPYGQYNQYGQYGQMGNMTPEMVDYWQRMQQWYMLQQQQGEGGDQAEQPGQPLNPQQQDDDENKREALPPQDFRNRDRDYSNGRRDGPPRGPRRGTPSGPGRGGRGRGGYNRNRGGYHPYSRGGRR